MCYALFIMAGPDTFASRGNESYIKPTSCQEIFAVCEGNYTHGCKTLYWNSLPSVRQTTAIDSA
jgi:hypothetical protein